MSRFRNDKIIIVNLKMATDTSFLEHFIEIRRQIFARLHYLYNELKACLEWY